MFARRDRGGGGDFDEQRRTMVERDLVARGISDRRVLDAMATVRREAFVPHDRRSGAYHDGPLPIGARQTISQPYIVALMAEAARVGPDDSVLEVGTGSGYGAAVLASLSPHVVTIERHETLADSARKTLADEGFDSVVVVRGDGTAGVADRAPFDVIVVTAAGPEIPSALVDQLAPGGRLVMPVGDVGGVQNLVRLRRDGNRFARDDLGGVRFVPLVADQ